MRSALAAVLLLATAAAPAATVDPGLSFATRLPASVVDVSGWELVSGDFRTPQLRGSYRFYVNPERLAIYQLMRYRVQRLGSEAGLGDAALGAERVVFIRRPGVREPIDCWERQPSGAAEEWRALVPDTDAYRAEMAMVTRLLAIHRAARTGR